MDEYVKIRDASVQTVIVQNEEAFTTKSANGNTSNQTPTAACVACKRQRRRPCSVSVSACSTPERGNTVSSDSSFTQPTRPNCVSLSLANTLQRNVRKHTESLPHNHKHVNFIANENARKRVSSSEGFSPLMVPEYRKNQSHFSTLTSDSLAARGDCSDDPSACLTEDDATIANYVNFTRLSLSDTKCSCPRSSSAASFSDLQDIVETRFGENCGSIASPRVGPGVRRCESSKFHGSFNLRGLKEEAVEERCFNRIFEERDLAVLKMVGRKRKQRLLRVLIFVLLTFLLATIIALAIIWSVTSIVEHNRVKTQTTVTLNTSNRIKSDPSGEHAASSLSPNKTASTMGTSTATSTWQPTPTTVPQFIWSEWSPCSATCGAGLRQRFILCRDERASLEDCIGSRSPTPQIERCALSTCTSQCTRACYHGGRCINDNRCSCEPSWSGRRCEIPVCNPRCENGGICINPGECQCPDGFFGPLCSNRISNSMIGMGLI